MGCCRKKGQISFILNLLGLFPSLLILWRAFIANMFLFELRKDLVDVLYLTCWFIMFSTRIFALLSAVLKANELKMLYKEVSSIDVMLKNGFDLKIDYRKSSARHFIKSVATMFITLIVMRISFVGYLEDYQAQSYLLFIIIQDNLIHISQINLIFFVDICNERFRGMIAEFLHKRSLEDDVHKRFTLKFLI